jgi:hypothetical protein
VILETLILYKIYGFYLFCGSPGRPPRSLAYMDIKGNVPQKLVGLAQTVLETGYGQDGPGSIPGMERFLSSPQRPEQLWGPPSPLSNGYRGLYPTGYSSRGVKLTTHLHLVPMSRMVQLYLHFPICLHGRVLN